MTTELGLASTSDSEFDSGLFYNPLELADDPYPTYCRLRDEAPVYLGSTDAGEFWALSRFDDVQRAARNWRVFSSADGNDLDDTGELFGPAPAMDLADPPVHTRMRRVLKNTFALHAIQSQLEPRIRAEVDELVRRLRSKVHVNLATDVAYPLPAAVICGWLGFPSSDHDQLRTWHSAMLERLPGKVRLPESAVAARDELWSYIRAAAADRRIRERGDLLTILVRAQMAGDLSEDEMLANALFIFDAGIVSTNALIASSLLHLNRFQDQRELLRQSPELIPGAVEEFLRFDAPFQWFTRVTTGEVKVGDTIIPAGARVVLIWASANRDERRWPRPDQLIVNRTPQRHLSFSEGIHHCLGAPLARLEMRILYEKLMPVLIDYELTGPVERRITPSERTIVSLPANVQWARRER